MSTTLDIIDPKRDYIAIAFKGGSGGKFLSAWLTNAKLINSHFKLTLEGSANPSEFEINHDFEQPKPIEFHKTYAQTVKPNKDTSAPYFYTTSTINPNELSDEVYKMIQITFDEDDVDLIFRLYCAKNYALVNATPLHQLYLEIYNSQIRISNIPKKQNIMFLSFKELMFGDVEPLINKLAEFTGLDPLKFERKLLDEWRSKSLEAADAIKPDLKEFYERNTYIS